MPYDNRSADRPPLPRRVPGLADAEEQRRSRTLRPSWRRAARAVGRVQMVSACGLTLPDGEPCRRALRHVGPCR